MLKRRIIDFYAFSISNIISGLPGRKYYILFPEFEPLCRICGYFGHHVSSLECISKNVKIWIKILWWVISIHVNNLLYHFYNKRICQFISLNGYGENNMLLIH